MNRAIIARISLLEGLDEAALNAIASQMTFRTFPRNTILVHEGDPSDSLFIVLSGKVKIYSSDIDGREVVLNLLAPYDCFGELALIDAEPRSASVITLEPCKMGIILRDEFLRYLEQQPRIAKNLLATLVRKLRRETESVKSLALMDVYGRTAKLLLDLAVESEGRATLERLSYREIASRVGASREMVGRIFKDLKQGGYISLEDNKIILNERLPSRW